MLSISGWTWHSWFSLCLSSLLSACLLLFYLSCDIWHFSQLAVSQVHVKEVLGETGGLLGFNSPKACGLLRALIWPLFTATDFTNPWHNVTTAVPGMWDFAGRFHWHFLKRSPETFTAWLNDFSLRLFHTCSIVLAPYRWAESLSIILIDCRERVQGISVWNMWHFEAA